MVTLAAIKTRIEVALALPPTFATFSLSSGASTLTVLPASSAVGVIVRAGSDVHGGVSWLLFSCCECSWYSRLRRSLFSLHLSAEVIEVGIKHSVAVIAFVR